MYMLLQATWGNYIPPITSLHNLSKALACTDHFLAWRSSSFYPCAHHESEMYTMDYSVYSGSTDLQQAFRETIWPRIREDNVRYLACASGIRQSNGCWLNTLYMLHSKIENAHWAEKLTTTGCGIRETVTTRNFVFWLLLKTATHCGMTETATTRMSFKWTVYTFSNLLIKNKYNVGLMKNNGEAHFFCKSC